MEVMKNLLMFVNPKRGFDTESAKLVKVQIDNSLQLGWTPEDIMLITNFDYSYGKCKATVIEDDEAYCPYSVISSKTTTIHSLFKLGLIKPGVMYWAHDFDAFQLVPFPEIDLGDADLGICDYTRKKKIAGGSIFFTSKAKSIFTKVNKELEKKKWVDEKIYQYLMDTDKAFAKRIKVLDFSYNFMPFNVVNSYKFAEKPIKVAHFHPYKTEFRIGQKEGENLFRWYSGKNKIHTPILTKRIINIFKYHHIP